MHQILGYCPQFDPLLGLMTGRETLRMFGRLKCVPDHLLEAYVEEMLVRVGVRPHADKPCGTYSGGNKRKLSLAIALLGRPKITFLDEPSTGMDPVARRAMWDVILSSLEATSVILTSHSMEECEALCSRIGIMVGGRFRCLGSTQHLKSRFGSGYTLQLRCAAAKLPSVRSFIDRRFKGAVLEEAHEGQLRYQLPKGGSAIGAIFSEVEAQREPLGITDYSLSQPTLEQIFIAMAAQQEEEDVQPGGFASVAGEAEAEGTKPGPAGQQQQQQGDDTGHTQVQALAKAHHGVV